jgi:hypothetical protein
MRDDRGSRRQRRSQDEGTNPSALMVPSWKTLLRTKGCSRKNENPPIPRPLQHCRPRTRMMINRHRTSHLQQSNFLLPCDQTRVWIPKARTAAPGESSVGISVLAIRGKLGSVRNPEIDLRLDSCADITLISEEFFNILRDKPKLQQGKRMNLWQLTDKDCCIKGYVRIPVLVESQEGILLEFEAEAYVVPKMTVPILLRGGLPETHMS